MATIQISSLTEATELSDSDIIHISSGGVDKRITIANAREDVHSSMNYFEDFASVQTLEGTTAYTTSGWYTIAESSSLAYEPVMADFYVGYRGAGRTGVLAFSVAAYDTVETKDRDNTFIRIRKSSGDATRGVENVRLAKSDDTIGAGFKIQVYLNVSNTVTFNKILLQNGMATNSGFDLVTPYSDDTPTLPDGSTTGTFLVAGAKYEFGSVGVDMYTEVGIYATSDDTIRFAVPWGETPFQNPTTITLNYPTTGYRFYDVGGSVALVTESDPFDSLFSLTADSKYIYFRATKTGHFSSLTQNSPLFLRVDGTDGSFELS